MAVPTIGRASAAMYQPGWTRQRVVTAHNSPTPARPRQMRATMKAAAAGPKSAIRPNRSET